jgi:hypothetical protein
VREGVGGKTNQKRRKWSPLHLVRGIPLFSLLALSCRVFPVFIVVPIVPFPESQCHLCHPFLAVICLPIQVLSLSPCLPPPTHPARRCSQQWWWWVVSLAVPRGGAVNSSEFSVLRTRLCSLAEFQIYFCRDCQTGCWQWGIKISFFTWGYFYLFLWCLPCI